MKKSAAIYEIPKVYYRVHKTNRESSPHHLAIPAFYFAQVCLTEASNAFVHSPVHFQTPVRKKVSWTTGEKMDTKLPEDKRFVCDKATMTAVVLR